MVRCIVRFSFMLALLSRVAIAAESTPLFEAWRGSAATVDGGLSRGVAFADAEGDGDPDLLVANTINYPEFLYRNDGGDFVQILETPPSLAGGFSEGASWIDFDNDGDLDIFVARTTQYNSVYRNEGGWLFVEHDAGDFSHDHNASSMACFADVDNDGWLDVFVVNRDGENDALYRNVARKHGRVFARLKNGTAGNNGGNGRTCAFGDVNNDGHIDLYVGNFIDTRTDPPSKERNYLYINRGDFRFSERTDGHAVELRALTYGASWADVDSDGDLDLFVTNIGIGDENQLYLNDGHGELIPHDAGIETAVDMPSKGHTWGDFDLDGDLDIAIANGTEGTEHIANLLYLNDGAARFRVLEGDPFVRDRDVSAGIAWADPDADGDLDLYVANWGGGDQDNALYRNTAHGSWLKISLVGAESNRMGLGARVSLETGRGNFLKRQVRWFYPQTGYASQNEPVVHFGLQGAQQVELLTVDWPSGRRDTYREIAANQHLSFSEGKAPEFDVVQQSNSNVMSKAGTSDE